MGREAIPTPKINSYSFCLCTGVLRHRDGIVLLFVHDITEIFLEMFMETRHWPNPSPAPNDIQGCRDCTYVSTCRHYSLFTVNTSSLVPRPPRPAFVACSTKSGGRPGRIYQVMRATADIMYCS